LERLGVGLLGDIRTALEGLKTVKNEIVLGDAWYLRSAFPFRTSDNRIEGVVITYVDITERKKAENEIQSLAKFPAENPNPIVRLSNDGLVLYFNRACEPLVRMWNTAIGKTVPVDICVMVAETLAGGFPKTV